MGVVAHSHVDKDFAARHSPGLSAVPSAVQPCVSKRDGPVAVREPRRMQARPNLIWTRSSWSRLGQLDVANLRRSQIKKAFPWSLGGARRAHVEGEWLGKMLWAGRHAMYMPWSSEGRWPMGHPWPGAGLPRVEIGSRERLVVNPRSFF